MKFPKALGKLIRDKRIAKDLYQRDVAKHLNVSSMFINRIETGRCDLPFIYTIPIKELLNITDEEFRESLMKDVFALLDKESAKWLNR